MWKRRMINFTNLSLISILILIIFNILWTLRLLQSRQCYTLDHYNSSTIRKAPLINEYNCIEKFSSPVDMYSYNIAFSDINFNIGRWDNKRLYKIYDFVLVGDSFKSLSADSVVCLATQSSIERLHSVVEVAKQWNSPISISVFIAGSEEFHILQCYVTYLRLCFDFIREKVSFHLAAPKEMIPSQTVSKWSKIADSFDCQYPEVTLRKLLKMRSIETVKWRLRNVYPQNHMRNLARKGCQNKYVFLTDVDIIPSKNISEQLNGFLKNTNCKKKCAYVIPTYEIDLRVKFPASKKELLRLVKKGLARPFHEKVFIYNQFATNFSRWQLDEKSDVNVFISHNVTNFEFLYEPFYVAQDNSPIHDERFVGYGFTRNSQVYEMYVAGYIFHVLSPIFTCHWGLQQKKSRPAWREQQNNMNRKRFETFKDEVLTRYKKDPLAMFSQKKNRRD